MPLGVATIMIPIFTVGGILLLRNGKKTGRKILTAAGITLFVALIGCLFYAGAALLLLGGID